MAANASPLVMLPLGPVGVMAAGSRLFSVTTRWTAGDRTASPAGALKAAEPVLADGAAAAASSSGRLSRRSFEVLSNLTGLFRNVEASRSAAKTEPARSGAVAPERMRAPGVSPVDVAEGARASGGFGTP